MPSLIDKSFYNTLDFLPEGYFIVDCDYKVISWNKALEVLTGVAKKEILNLKLQDFFPNFQKDNCKKRIDPIFKGGPPVVFSAQLHKDLFSQINNPQDLYYQVTISSLRLEEKMFSALFSVENRNKVYGQINDLKDLHDKALTKITEKEEVHSKLVNQHIQIEEAFLDLSEKNMQIEIQRQQLLELNATKDKFFSIIAHDLINPFSSLMNFSSIIYKKFESFTPDELKKMIGQLHQSSEHTFELLQNLLQWSKAQSQKLENKPIKIELAEIVRKNIKLVKNIVFSKQIEISHKIPGELFVFVDHNMIDTVLRNLISNAIKFTPAKGEIIISIHKDSKASKPDKQFTVIKIHDTGVGMSADKMKKLFKIEENTSTRGTNNEAGNGLGLILCKDFVDLMGGRIWIESEESKGSSFFIKIPVYN